jgi:hypothetical protein
MHFYGRDTTIFTTTATSVTPLGDHYTQFAVIAPSNALPVTVRSVRANVAATSEETNFTADTTTSDHSQRGMSKAWSTSKSLNFHLIFLSGSNPSASESGIATAISKLKTAYSQNTVKINPNITSTTITANDYLTLTSSSINSTAAGSLGGLFVNTSSAQNKDAVNIYFVKNATSPAGLLGVAGGIPGLPGKSGTRNSAMVVVFDNHLTTPGTSPNESEQTLLAETMAHEAGHWLGLFHLVESNYNGTQTIYTRDAISETPRCTGSPVNITNCNGTSENNSGAKNIMFWTGQTGFSQPDFTGEQGWVLRRHPLVY